jgi:hypothetical protein
MQGKYAELLGLLQERYGHAKEQAERESMIGLSGSRYIASPNLRRFALGPNAYADGDDAPKNRGPDQRAPVIFRATRERER